MSDFFKNIFREYTFIKNAPLLSIYISSMNLQNNETKKKKKRE